MPFIAIIVVSTNCKYWYDNGNNKRTDL